MSDKEVTGFFDGHCPKCHKRIGWYGTLTDRPPCRGCDYIPDKQTISEDKKALRDLDVFCLLQTLLYNKKELINSTELSFLYNMYKKHRGKKGGFTEIQSASIRGMARKYNVLENKNV